MGLLGLSLLFTQIQSPPFPPLIFHFLDVGYGDAIIIELPENRTILVDTGKPSDGPLIVQALQNLGITQLDYLIITHFHKDHVGGLLNLTEVFEYKENIGKILIPFLPTDSQLDPALTGIIEVFEKYSHEIVRKGKKLEFFPSIYIEVLHPDKLSGDQNNDSLILKIVYGATSFLLAADAGIATQKKLIEAYGDELQSTLIKIPHHANDTDIFEPFIKAVHPEISILTIGNNSYGAPNPEILSRYEEKSRLYRTDKNGNITVISDGRSLRAMTEKP